MHRWWRRTVNNGPSTTGDFWPQDLPDVVDSLTKLSDANALLPRDRQALDKARQFLIWEISEVLEQSREAAKDQTDKALDGKNKNSPERGRYHSPGRRRTASILCANVHRREAIASPFLKQLGGYGNTKALTLWQTLRLLERAHKK